MFKRLLATAALLAAFAVPSAQAYTCANTDTFAAAVACADGDGFDVNDSTAAVWSMILANGWNTTYGFTNPVTQFKDNNVLSTDVPPSSTSLFDVAQNALDASQGTLTFSMSLNGPFVLTLKGGSSWAGYVFTGNATAGDTITFDIPGTTARGLSHASIYTNNEPFMSPVAEPSSVAMMFAGLVALGFVARRRKA